MLVAVILPPAATCTANMLSAASLSEFLSSYCRPTDAFGAEGRDGIPPNSTVLVSLTLNEIHKVEQPVPGVVTKVMSRKEPRAYATPSPGSQVKLVGKGMLTDGTVFQEWTEGEELAFTTDELQVHGLGFRVMT